MFAKLLAELKRIAILLQSKKLVDKDYVPDEGGGSETDDKFYLLNETIIAGLSFQKSDLTKIDFTTITGDCLANELFTTKGIDVINKIIKNLPSTFIDSKSTGTYFISTINTTITDYNFIWLPNNNTDKSDFVLIGINEQNEAEGGRKGIDIVIHINDNNTKVIHAYLSEGTYLTENTQFTYIDYELEE